MVLHLRHDLDMLFYSVLNLGVSISSIQSGVGFKFGLLKKLLAASIYGKTFSDTSRRVGQGITAPSPLRTARTSFPVSGSSTCNAYGQRSSYRFVLMNLNMTNRM